MRMDVLYFMGFDIDEELPWHSTISRTRQLYPIALFKTLFNKVFALCVTAGMVSGENRNFDLRKEFKAYLDGTSIQAYSIFNSAFTDILKYNTPILNLKDKSIAYWGEKAGWKLDFTNYNIRHNLLKHNDC